MLPNQTIDFLRDDWGGPWFIMVLFGIMGIVGILNRARKKDFIKGGWRTVSVSCLLAFIIASLVASPIALFVMIWQRWPPQYFITLRVEQNQVRLGQRWPNSDLVIPFSDIISVSRIHESRRSLRNRSCNRIVIQTSSESYRSFGYERSTEEEQKVWEKLVALVEEKQRSKPTRPADTNIPPAKLQR